MFLGGAPNDDKKVVKAFIGLTSNASTALKRHPKVSPNPLGPHAFTRCFSIPVLRLWPSIMKWQMPAINGLESLTRSHLDGSFEFRHSRISVTAPPSHSRRHSSFRISSSISFSMSDVHRSELMSFTILSDLLGNWNRHLAATGCVVDARRSRKAVREDEQLSPVHRCYVAHRQTAHTDVSQGALSSHRHCYNFICELCMTVLLEEFRFADGIYPGLPHRSQRHRPSSTEEFYPW